MFEEKKINVIKKREIRLSNNMALIVVFLLG